MLIERLKSFLGFLLQIGSGLAQRLNGFSREYHGEKDERFPTRALKGDRNTNEKYLMSVQRFRFGRLSAFGLFVSCLAYAVFEYSSLSFRNVDTNATGNDALQFASPTTTSAVREISGKLSDRIPDVTLIDHDGNPVRFYHDFVQGKKVAINFMYTICKGICPGMTENIKSIRQSMAELGRTDFTFISVSIEPDQDTPQQLRRYMKINQIVNEPGMPPWIFLTGNLEDIDRLRRSLGVYDLDPVTDADRTQHGGIITFGNDNSDWWGASAALQPPRLTLDSILRIAGDDDRGHP